MQNNFYVYEHWRPDRDECFYVGKGRGKRANAMYKRNKHHQAIQEKLARLGMCVEVRIVASGLTEKESFELEQKRIKFWRSENVDIANMTDGGEGTSGHKQNMTPEWRKKLSKAHQGKKRSPEAVEKAASAKRGKPHSEQHSKRISESQKKRFQDPTVKEKFRLCSVGRIPSKETRMKMSIAAKNRRGCKKLVAAGELTIAPASP
jgi:hypothetical protein